MNTLNRLLKIQCLKAFVSFVLFVVSKIRRALPASLKSYAGHVACHELVEVVVNKSRASQSPCKANF